MQDHYILLIFIIIIVVILLVLWFGSTNANNNKIKRKPKFTKYKDSKPYISKVIIYNKSGNDIFAKVGSEVFGVHVYDPTVYNINSNENLTFDASTTDGEVKLNILNMLIGKTACFKISTDKDNLGNAPNQEIKNFPNIELPDHDVTCTATIDQNLQVQDIKII